MHKSAFRVGTTCCIIQELGPIIFASAKTITDKSIGEIIKKVKLKKHENEIHVQEKKGAHIIN
jgi:hypothetical protein